ncbi:MAG TPA: EamA family transporter [Polyangia bacterium]|nr:EamA family transporter [Polyangia bacterium]
MSDVGPDQPPSTSPNHRALMVLAFAAVYLIWGSTYLAIRVGVRSIPPFLMAGCRFVGAGSLLYALLRARGTPAPSRGEWARAALAGLLMLTTGNGLVSWAERQVPSNVAALIVAAVPLYMALLDWARPGGRPPARRVMIGIGIGAAGMVLLVSGGHDSSREVSVVGMGAILVSGLAWSAGSLYARYGRMHAHPVMAAAQQMLAGGAAMLAIAALRGEPAAVARAGVTRESALALGYLMVFGSMVAFSAFGWLVKATTPTRISTVAYVNPVVAVILGWAILDERLGPRAIAGATLILVAVLAMTLRVPARRAHVAAKV